MSQPCGCAFSTLPGKEIVCAQYAGHQGPHHAQGVTWTNLFPAQRMVGPTPVRVRCVGHPGTTPPCSWTGTTTLGDPVEEGHCPTCDGLLQAVAGPPPDPQQAIHAEKLAAAGFLRAHATRHPDSDLSLACLHGAEALEELQAAQAENQQLRQAARDFLAAATEGIEPIGKYDLFNERADALRAALGQVDQ